MLTKDGLKKHFGENYGEFYSVPLFENEGFERKVCPKCGKGYWTASDAPTCGDSSHEEYSFFRETPRSETYASFWEKTADFWKRNGHEVIDRYPVLSRWRDDLPFTIASIVDFQRLEAGKVVFEYPTNPLFVPQMCLRFPDIANVGVTGRHFTCFMMAGQHSFNYPREGYWKVECLDYNYKYLREVLGIPKGEITYGEDVWNMPDFSAFGPCIESFAHGSELVNSVFMQYRQNGDSFSELEMKVIDVGWGFERLLWYNNGTRSAYDAVFPNEVEYMKQRTSFEISLEIMNAYAALSATLDVDTVVNLTEEKRKIARKLGLSIEEMEKTIAPLQGIYAIADHSRSLLFALSDGALPSNVGGGYNLRVLARRAFSFIDKYEFDFSLFDLVAMHAEDLRGVFPELRENLDTVEKILGAEKRKYLESREKAKKIASDVVKKSTEISTKQMMTLYESNGINPETLEAAGRELGVSVNVPTNFYAELTKQREMQKATCDEDESAIAGRKILLPDLDTSALPATKQLYYGDFNLVTASATLLGWHKNALIFDQSIFYPEGGGQMNDTGSVKISECTFDIVNVQKQGKVILHFVAKGQESKFSEITRGAKALMELNFNRRRAIMKHHSATHLLNGICRGYFGKHVWQCGSKKDEDEAHLDLTHFEKPTLEDVHEIERRVNEAISRNIPIQFKHLNRKEAETEYGMQLYQGGGAVADMLRIIDITGLDTEACGGTHCHNTSEIEFFKIKNVEQVQDGVIRFTYCASLAALKYVQEIENMLQLTANNFSASRSELLQVSKKFFNEWKEQRKELETLRGDLASGIAREEIAKHHGDKKVVLKVNLPAQLVEKIADQIGSTEGFVAVVSNHDGFVTISCNENSGASAIELLKAIGAKGGGSQKFARGKLAN